MDAGREEVGPCPYQKSFRDPCPLSREPVSTRPSVGSTKSSRWAKQARKNITRWACSKSLKPTARNWEHCKRSGCYKCKIRSFTQLRWPCVVTPSENAHLEVQNLPDITRNVNLYEPHLSQYTQLHSHRGAFPLENVPIRTPIKCPRENVPSDTFPLERPPFPIPRPPPPPPPPTSPLESTSAKRFGK